MGLFDAITDAFNKTTLSSGIDRMQNSQAPDGVYVNGALVSARHDGKLATPTEAEQKQATAAGRNALAGFGEALLGAVSFLPEMALNLTKEALQPSAQEPITITGKQSEPGVVPIYTINGPTQHEKTSPEAPRDHAAIIAQAAQQMLNSGELAFMTQAGAQVHAGDQAHIKGGHGAAVKQNTRGGNALG